MQSIPSREPPPQGPPPSYAFVSRMYRRSLRPVVVGSAFMGGVWALFSGIGWFRNYGVDRTQNVPSIAHLSIALGAFYLSIAVIGVFGIYAALTQRAPLVRIYSFLTVFATLIVIATGLTRIVTHFIWKNDLIRECKTLTTNEEIVYYGFWGPIRHDRVTPDEATQWCQDAWSHDSWAEIISFLVLTVLACLFTLFAFSFYRQLLDPTSPANATRAPSSQVRMGGFPVHYNPPYGPPPGQGYSQPPYPGGSYGAPADYGYGYNGYVGERDDPFAPPYDGKPPGYVGVGNVHDAGKKDPFGDGTEVQERDVTTRAALEEDEPLTKHNGRV